MIACDKCGTKNPLGRVFCSGCSAKLDLSLAEAEIDSGRMVRPRSKRIGRPIAAITILAAVAALGLALWPHQGGVGRQGTVSQGQRASRQLQALHEVRENTRINAAFHEPDINAYLSYAKVRRLNLESLSVAVDRDGFSVRLIKRFPPLRAGKREMTPRLSVDFSFAATEQGVTLRQTRLGHLPLWGPLAGQVRRQVAKLLSQDRDWTLLAHIVAGETADGLLTLTFQK